MLTSEELDSLDAEQRAIYEAASPRDKVWFEKNLKNRTRSNISGTTAATIPMKPTSLMRVIGLIGTIISVLALVIFVLKPDGNRSASEWALAILAASSVTVFTFMWMLGAIESRLIDINETLKAKR